MRDLEGSHDNKVVQFKSNGDVRSDGRGQRLTFFKTMMEHLELNQLNLRLQDKKLFD